ncbi:MAG TPA: 1-acyl-sn-glycerol-3-phosphate acyltransferase [Pyrinomonadaceae bacterium]|nr:1-acyl-sn-glycerol-3-phosphate acyltransferase [Pyrinomonadaceae bacterium]
MRENREANRIESVKVLRLWEMIFLGKGTFARRIIHAFISIALRLFFRRIEAVNVETVPKNGAIIFVLNHPNGLVDPALVFVSLARRVSFLAKSTLFDIPVAGYLLRLFEILPVFRRVDATGDMQKNVQTFQNCYELLAQNRCIAIFPEGISHNETKLQPIKTGAARIALGALGFGENKKGVKEDDAKGRQSDGENLSVPPALAGGSNEREVSIDDQTANPQSKIPNPKLNIMAVGLYYTSKTSFRSEALIRYGEIIEVEPVELDENGEPPREAVYALNEKIENALRNVTLNLETQNELDAILKAEALFSSVYENLLFKNTLTQSFGRLQDLAKKYQLLAQNDPQKMRELNEKIGAYEAKLDASGITAESLSVLQHPTAYVFRYLILRVLVLLILSPLAIIGAIIHSPAYFFSNLLGRTVTTHDVDAAGSSSKIIAAMIFMPLTWLITALTFLYFYGWQLALLSIPLTILCGYIALRSSETLIDLNVWIKSAWLLFRQRALFLRLLVQRETLQKEIGEIVETEK